MYQIQQNKVIQETKATMSFMCKYGTTKTQRINPSKYGYAQTTNSILKTINLDLEDFNDWAMLDSCATGHFLVTDASAKGMSNTTNLITVIIQDGSKLTSTHE